MKHCAKVGCTNQATCIPSVMIPAKGCPIAEHDPIKITANVPLCNECFKLQKPSQWLHESLRVGLEISCSMNHLAPPDFKRAFMQASALP